LLAIGFVLEKHPDGWRVLVFVLTIAYTPDERDQKADGQQETENDQEEDDTHVTVTFA
jgi:hypothetical protein